MKHLKTFEENSVQLRLWDNLPIKYKNETVFHNNNWLVIKPKSYETLYELSKDTEWGIENVYKNYHPSNNFKPIKYKMNDYIYVNINKKTGDKFLFDFHKEEYIDKEEDEIYLKDFFESNNDLFNFYGEIVECSNVVKKGNDYWIMADDNEWFADFYKVDANTNDKFIKSVLSGDAIEFFEYHDGVDLDEYGLELDDDALLLIKIILLLEKGYDYTEDEIFDISDYDDVVNIIQEYDVEPLKNTLILSATWAKESADEAKAFEDVANEFYNFFGLVDGSAKWENVKGHNYQKLFIKFKTKEDAYYAKFRICEYDDSYSDDMIEYSPPYYGYSGDVDVKNENFNSELFQKIADDFDNYSEIESSYEVWKKLKEENKSDEEIFAEIKIRLDASKYNV